MVLEATMIVIDNSEYMRNGDFPPSRFAAQSDTVNLIFSAKTQSNPESAVGLMTMAGRAPEVLVTLTTDFGKIVASMVETKVHDSAHLTTAIQVAALSLKHRQNKSQRQRVIVFVGSPVTESESDLIKLAKKMKKNNIAVDFINFGEETENEEKLSKFLAAVKSGENSHLVNASPGPQLLSDIVLSSSILTDEDGVSHAAAASASAGGGSGTGGDAFEFGVDPNLDPELALALRMSLEEERARQEREKKAQEATTAATSESIPEEPENEQITPSEQAGGGESSTTGNEIPGAGEDESAPLLNDDPEGKSSDKMDTD
ncbi:uncharacterized protein V1516DRAFT_667377 [Lipomyces oligophaga]|uniref:uncharacterized protein n=1 Tax=Lipomyces oligophaga TaxID=45792 RepID=UPI0034CF7F2B